MNLRIMQSPPVPVGSRYSPQHPILKYPLPMFLPQFERPCFAPVYKLKNFSSKYFSGYVFDIWLKERRVWAKWYQAFPEFNLLLSSSRLSFWFVWTLSSYSKFSTLSRNLLSLLMFFFSRSFCSNWRLIRENSRVPTETNKIKILV